MASTDTQSNLEKIRAKYKLKAATTTSSLGAWKHKNLDGKEYQSKIRAERERKPVVKPGKKSTKEYYVIAYEDLVFWVANANRTIFSDALTQYNKLKKRGVTLEIRWYWDKIDIHVL